MREINNDNKHQNDLSNFLYKELVDQVSSNIASQVYKKLLELITDSNLISQNFLPIGQVPSKYDITRKTVYNWNEVLKSNQKEEIIKKAGGKVFLDIRALENAIKNNDII
jgi:hypothetical protein